MRTILLRKILELSDACRNSSRTFKQANLVRQRENLLITGATGAGKSYLASALGHQACLLGYRTLYFNTQKLFSRLKMLKANGSYSREINKIERADLLPMGLQIIAPH